MNEDIKKSLWDAANTMRGHMDASEYKHVALGLIFLKYISDSFEEVRQRLKQVEFADPEDKDEYNAENCFWVPRQARWENIKTNAKSVEIGRIIDDAMRSIEKENDQLKGVLQKDYARSSLKHTVLGGLIDLISNITMNDGDHKDILGRVYEYFLGRFASAEGKGGGEFYTPESVVRLLVAMLEPYHGRVYDPCCGSGGMFVQSKKFLESHNNGTRESKRQASISIYGQESNFTTWRLCKMNLAIRGIDGNIGSKNEDTFHRNLHRDLRADYILANPPFNISDWGQERLQEDIRWHYGMPPAGNANYAWIQHIIHHLAPRGLAGLVLANGSMSSTQGGEDKIRQNLIKADLVDCMIALPSQLFYTTQIPACLWFFAKDRSNGLVEYNTLRDRRGEILFIDARQLGKMVDRVHRDFDDDDMSYIVDAYHAWRGETVTHEAFKDGYKDVAGFCKSATMDEVAAHEYILTPGRYVGAPDAVDDGVPFATKMQTLTEQLAKQMKRSYELDDEIRKQLGRIGYGL